MTCLCLFNVMPFFVPGQNCHGMLILVISEHYNFMYIRKIYVYLNVLYFLSIIVLFIRIQQNTLVSFYISYH